MILANPHNAKTLSAIEALSFRSSGQLSWHGIPLKLNLPTSAVTRNTMTEQIACLLYHQFYCYGHVVPLPSESPRNSPVTKTAIDGLITANRERFRWEGGWQVISNEGGYMDVERGGLRVLVNPGAWRSAQEGQVEVQLTSGSFAMNPGFYTVTAGGSFQNPEVIRVYWNVSMDAASRLISALASSLGRQGIPYRVKVLTDLSRPGRADSCVLYLQQRDFREAGECIGRIYHSIAKFARAAVPAYSFEIAEGLSVAEQPPGEESFGQHRCRILAEGIMLATEAGARSGTERLAKVREHFSRCGYSLERPHLNPDSEFDYSLPIQSGSQASGPQRRELVHGRESFLELAVQIGENLVRRAVWYLGRCNWVGYLTGPRHVFGSLGPDLYSGTSGIAWFLAELFRVTAQEEFRRTSEGAIRHACDIDETSFPALGKGLYVGWTGIAFAAWRCSALLSRPELNGGARRALDLVREIPADCEVPDLISGEAGAILGLLLLGDQAAQNLAHDYGSAVVRKARRSHEAYSWKTTGRRNHPHLTGFAHGTAGIAAALIALYARTGRSEFREAACGGLNYERVCFNEVQGNWPDFRGVGNRREPRRYACAWCHGAPGMALSRQLAAQVLESANGFRTDKNIALETTRSALAKGLVKEQGFCLCHGMAGNADILNLVGNESDRDLIREVGNLGVERFGNGVQEADPIRGLHGLMTGIAGIGHFYLRLYDRTVPSPLWIGPKLELEAERA